MRPTLRVERQLEIALVLGGVGGRLGIGFDFTLGADLAVGSVTVEGCSGSRSRIASSSSLLNFSRALSSTSPRISVHSVRRLERDGDLGIQVGIKEDTIRLGDLLSSQLQELLVELLGVQLFSVERPWRHNGRFDHDLLVRVPGEERLNSKGDAGRKEHVRDW